jgi:PST family polysaccharide transporter
MALAVISPVVALQALAAPWYVPVLFGPDWAHLSEVVGILCLAAIPAVIWSATAQWLRARDCAGAEFRRTLVMTVALIGTIALLAPHGLVTIAWGYMGVVSLTQIGFATPAIRAAVFATPQEV